MSTDRLRLGALVAFTGVLILTSMGFAAPQVADEPNARELVLDAVESTNNKPIQGVRTEVFQRAGQFEMVTVEVTEASPTRSRIKLIGATQAEEHSDLTVVNGSTRWEYFRERRQAIQTRTTGEWRDRGFGTNTRELINEYVIEYKGTARVEERTTHVVELTAPEPRSLELSLDIQTRGVEYEFELQEAARDWWYIAEETWWIDTETSYPVRQQIEWTDQNGETLATTIRTYHELTVGADVDSDAFGFEPPNGTTVTKPSLPETSRHRSPGAAETAAGFDVPEPSVPDRYEFHDATVRRFDSGTSVTLAYVSGSETLTVRASERAIRGDGERVVKRGVGAVDGTLLSVDGRPSLTWECGGLSHRVSGPRNAEVLTAVADSVGCEPAGPNPTAGEETPTGASPTAPSRTPVDPGSF